MVKKDLYTSMDAYFDRIHSGCPVDKKSKYKEEGFKGFFKKCKNYFSPTPEYEQISIISGGATIVKKIDKGFKRHMSEFKEVVRDLFKSSPEFWPEPEDIDVSEVKEVMEKDKI